MQLETRALGVLVSYAKMCEKEKITFIDNTELVQEEYYEVDGIHMTSVYYPEWLNQMAEAAEL